MKVLKVILLVLGLIGATVAGVMLFMAMNVELKVIWEIATRYSTASDLRDPRPNLMIISGIVLGAGLLLGLGLGLPTRVGPSQKRLEEQIENRVQARLNVASDPTTEPTPPPAP